MKRFFAYGCSFTKWDYPTWADFIGVNFDEYYNHGRGGCDHTYILDKIHEDNIKYKFNPETDFLVVATTGINRLSWYRPNRYCTVGDLYNWQNSIIQAGLEDSKKLEGFFDLMWNLDWAAIRAANAIIQIKTFLDLLKINHEIIQGMTFKYILDVDLGLQEHTKEKLKISCSMIKDIPSIDDYRCDYEIHTSDDEVGLDGHPGQPRHYEFIKQYFPHFITDKTQQFYNDSIETIFLRKYPSRANRQHQYRNVFLKSYPNFINE